MIFKKHVTPVDFREHNQYREEKAVAAFVACAREINANYSISGRFKVYRQRMEAVTLTIGGKSFTTRGDNALYDTCTAAVYYVLDNYVQFADLKKEKDRLLEEKNKMCKPKRVATFLPMRNYGI